MTIPLLMAGGFFGAFIFSFCLNWLALIPWRCSIGAHWTERSRLLFPARRSARFNLWLLTTIVCVATSAFAPWLNYLFTGVPTVCGGLLAGYFLNRQIFPEMPFAQWLQFIIVICFLAFSSLIVIVAAATVMPADFGIAAWLIAGGALIAMLSLQFGLNVRLLRSLRVLKPVPERLMTLVREVSEKMNIPPPATWVVDAPISNAAALPGPRELVFTEKLLATHPDDEIKAICAHEIGHLTEPRQVRLTRLLLPVFMFPLVFLRPIQGITGQGLTGPLIILIPIVLCFIFAVRLSRRMEKRADRLAIEQQGDPAIYARALERVYRTNQMPAVMPRRINPAPHPDLYDRMLAAGITPDFPKPVAPKKFVWPTYLLFGIFCLPFVVYFLTTLHVLPNSITIQIRAN